MAEEIILKIISAFVFISELKRESKHMKEHFKSILKYKSFLMIIAKRINTISI